MASVIPERTSLPDQPRTLQGTTPGLLDPSQAKRLLRIANSKLSFASFDPLTAHGGDDIPDLRKMSIKEDQPRPKRIVVETSPEGHSSWRFVPRAVLEEGVTGEGPWPRLVNVCGERIFLDENQWDIYKLDPAYICVVHFGFKHPSITRVELSATQDTETPGVKRFRQPSPSIEQTIPQHDSKRPRPPTCCETDTESDDEDEVEKMVIDGVTQPQKLRNQRRPWSSREEMEKQRVLRREKLTRSQMKRNRESQSHVHISEDSASTSSQRGRSMPAGKRKALTVESSTDGDMNVGDEHQPTKVGTQKRMRTVSPHAIQSALKALKSEREKRKQAKLRQADEHRRKLREWAQMNELQSGLPYMAPHSTENREESPVDDHPESDEEENEDISHEDAARQALLAESIQKMRELDKDRPLWEEERRKREAREKAEEEERCARAEERKRAETERARQRREEEERIKRAEEAAQQRKEEEARWQREKRRRQGERWGTGIWTSQRALERYKVLSEAFDNAKFSPNLPITFEDIPWPVLHHPQFSVEDVDWQAVETFFAAVRTHMRTQDYKEFVQKSHRRFHPDRWRARKVWAAVPDELERECLEVVANTVAQALTPIWLDAKDL